MTFKIKVKQGLVVLVVPFVIGSTVNAVAGENQVQEKKSLVELTGASIGNDYVSQYVTGSGSIFNDSPVVQSSVDFTTNLFGVNVWNNYVVRDHITNERDVEVRVPFSTEYVNLKLAGCYSTFPNTYFGEGFVVTGKVSSTNLPVDLSLAVPNVFWEGYEQGRRFDFGIGKSFEDLFTDGLNLGLNGFVKYNDRWFALEGDKTKDWSHYGLSGNVSYSLPENVSLNVGINYQKPFEGSKFEDKYKETFWNSFGVNWGFD